MMVCIDVLTLFPSALEAWFGESILARAQAKGLVQLRAIDLRCYTEDRHHVVDDTPFGGSAGMLMKVEPVVKAIADLRRENSQVVLLAAQGQRFRQALAQRFSEMPHLILIAGHYEGIDARIAPEVDVTVSIGAYVLTGGEAAALVVADAVTRLVPGVIDAASLREESFSGSLLEGPQYTRPREFQQRSVPPVLFSGNHGEIARFKRKEALRTTLDFRPGLLLEGPLSSADRLLLQEILRDEGVRSDGCNS